MSTGALSPTEQFIVDSIGEGRTDAEISVRLGLTVGDVKARVERLRRMAGAGSRAELAGWRPPEADEEVPGPEPGPAMAQSPGRPRRYLAAGGIAALAIAGGAWWALAEPRGEPAAPVSVSTTAAPGAGASASRPTPPFAEALIHEPDAGFPARLLLFVETGCAGCSAAPTGLDRISRDVNGLLRAETVFRAPREAGHHIISSWATVDAARIFVTECVAGQCGPEGFVSTDALSRVMESRDLGNSWQQIAEVPGAAVVTGVRGASVELRVTVAPGTIGATGSVLIHEPPLPSGTRPIPPEFDFIEHLDAATVRGLTGVLPGPGGYGYSWLEESPLPDLRDYVTFLGLADASFAVQRVLEYRGGRVQVQAWLDSHRLVANIEQVLGAELAGTQPSIVPANIPAIVDFERGTIRPIAEPFTTVRYVESRNRVIAAIEGRFARLATSPDRLDDCLPVGPEPGEVAADGCIRAGSFVAIGPPRAAGGERWVLVWGAGGSGYAPVGHHLLGAFLPAIGEAE